DREREVERMEESPRKGGAQRKLKTGRVKRPISATTANNGAEPGGFSVSIYTRKNAAKKWVFRSV
ncbi:MAG: hypothetical protein WBJ40_08735, partial [Methanoculleus sp.]